MIDPQICVQIDQIAAEASSESEARIRIGQLALRERAPMTELLDYFLEEPCQDRAYCPRCDAVVPSYEFASGTCLDCVQQAYEEHAQ